jgi:outer membrane immunogenic protein
MELSVKVGSSNMHRGFFMMRMISVTAAAVSLAGLGSAQATDMAVKAIPKKAPVEAVWAWTGFYVGGNAGYSWSKWGSSGLTSASNPSVNGALGGVQAGYNWQLNAAWLVGLEGDIQVTGERAREDGVGAISTDVAGGSPPFVDPGTFHTIATHASSNQWKFPWFGTFRGRVGVLADPTTLIYGTGGLAVGEFKFSSQPTVAGQTYRGVVGTTTNPLAETTAFTAGVALSDSTTRAGWAIGAGVEKKFTRNWSAKLEYLYLDFGTHTFLSGTGSATQIRLHDNIVRLGLNYQFDAPVVSKF